MSTPAFQYVQFQSKISPLLMLIHYKKALNGSQPFLSHQFLLKSTTFFKHIASHVYCIWMAQRTHTVGLMYNIRYFVYILCIQCVTFVRYLCIHYNQIFLFITSMRSVCVSVCVCSSLFLSVCLTLYLSLPFSIFSMLKLLRIFQCVPLTSMFQHQSFFSVVL